MSQHRGGCHCGQVRFEVEAPEDLEVYECNCSLCSMTGFLHLIVPQKRFHLLQGQDALITYSFNTHTAKHLFCRACGVKSFYIPRSNPDGYSVNVRCLDKGSLRSMKILPFDGRNWEQDAGRLSHLTASSENKK